MANDFQRNYRIIVEKIFNNYQNLRLAVEHSMGGRNSHKAAIQIMDYMYESCIGNEKIDCSDLENVLEDLMDQELNTICDDNSIHEICQNLLRYKQMSQEGRYAEIEAELSKLPQGKVWLKPDAQITYVRVEEEDSSDDDDSDDEEMDLDDEEEDEKPTTSRRSTRKKEEFVEPEPGWTTVRRK